MQVVNKKERSNAKWRFAGLYLFSLALPVLLLFNARNMNKMECEDTSQLVEQLKLRDQALAQLSQLAITFNKIQQLKPFYEEYPEALNKKTYDSLNTEFANGVKKLRTVFSEESALYSSNSKVLEALDYNYSEYNKIPDVFNTKLQERIRIKEEIAKVNPVGGSSGNSGQLVALQIKLENAQDKVKELQDQLRAQPDPNNSAKDLEELREKAEDMDKNIDGINVLLSGIEEDASKIQRRGDANLEAKKKILEKIQNLKSHTANIKNSNNILLAKVR